MKLILILGYWSVTGIKLRIIILLETPQINQIPQFMRWETVTATPTNETYHLWDNDKKMLSLTLHPFSNSARVESADEKRVFLVRKEGFRRNKTVVRNEYGIKVGELGTDEKGNYIDVNNERFYYTIQHEPGTELVLYKESPDKPSIVCEFTAGSGSPVRLKKDKDLGSQAGLLMAICWYMFLPETKAEHLPAMAV
jgi:hypothetical protein